MFPATTFACARGVKVLERAPPPAPPPRPLLYGGGCWKAVCTVTKPADARDSAAVVEVGRAIGVGPTPEIAADTQAACARHVEQCMPRRGARCGDPQLFLTHLPPCERTIVFVLLDGGKTTKLL